MQILERTLDRNIWSIIVAINESECVILRYFDGQVPSDDAIFNEAQRLIDARAIIPTPMPTITLTEVEWNDIVDNLNNAQQQIDLLQSQLNQIITETTK